MKRSLSLIVVLLVMAMPHATLAHPLSTPSLSVWTQSPAYKVQPTTAPGSGSTATMEGARGAYEAYQLIVHASGSSLSGVNMSASVLSDGNGHTIPATSISFYLETMIDFTGVQAINGVQPVPAQSPTNDGRLPDPLVPFVDPYTGQAAAAPFTVTANTNQPVWMDVAIPTGATSGTYTGSVTVSAAGQANVIVPVTLIVWSFTLPDMSVATAYFKMSTNSIGDFHGGTDACSGNSCYLDWNKPLTRTIVKRYEELAHTHRIDTGQNFVPDPIASDQCSPPTDWSAYDDAVAPYMNGSYWSDGVPSTRLTVPFTPGANWGPEATCTAAQYTALAAAWAAHLKAKGWFSRAIVYALDEPDASSFPAIAHDSLLMQAGDPDWKSHIMDTTAARSSNVAVLNPALGIYTTDLSWYDTWFHQGSDLFGRAQWPGQFAQGIKLWLYTANGDEPPYADYSTNTLLGMEPQMVKWGAWYEQASGFLYWDMTDWDESNPWGPNITYGKTGDGVLIYPGNHNGQLAPKGSPANVSIDGPIPSYRLQMIREGLQDWALFTLAERYGLGAYARGQVAQAYGQLGACSWSGCTPVNGQFLWSTDATLIAQIRHNVAQAIMNSAASGTPTVTPSNTPVVPTSVATTPVPASATALHTSTPTVTPSATASATALPTHTLTTTPSATPGVATATATSSETADASATMPAASSTATATTTTTPGAASATPTQTVSTPATSPTPSVVNLLRNASFEHWVGGHPLSWHVSGIPSPGVTLVTKGAQSGQFAAQVDAQARGAGLYQTVTFPRPQVFSSGLTALAHVKYISGDSTHAPAMTLELRYANGRQIRVTARASGWPGHHGWLAVRLSIPTRHARLARLTLRLTSTSSATQSFQIDNVSLSPSSHPVTLYSRS